MPQITPQLALLVLLIFPGLLGHSILSALTYTAQPSWSGRIVVAVILSAAAYLSLMAFRLFGAYAGLPDPVLMFGTSGGPINDGTVLNAMWCVLSASCFSFIYSLLLVASHNHRVMYRLARRVGLTTKSGFVNEWDSALMLRARKRWVMALMKDGTAFTGWPESHDVASDERAIVLSKVREYDSTGAHFEWPPDEILYLNSLDDVRALRFIPHKEIQDGKEGTAADNSVAQEDRDKIGKHESEPRTEGAPSGVTDQAELVTGQLE